MSTSDRACEIMQELQNNNNEHMEELQNLCHAQLRSIIKTSNFKFFAAWSKENCPAILKEMQTLCDFTFHSVAELEAFLFE